MAQMNSVLLIQEHKILVQNDTHIQEIKALDFNCVYSLCECLNVLTK